MRSAWQAVLMKSMTIHFSEAFSAWIHLKALRVFVESVLRFGVPVNFNAFLVRVCSSPGAGGFPPRRALSL